MTIALRPAVPDDVPILADIWRASAYASGIPSPTPEAVCLDHELATGTGIVAVDDNRIIGYGVIVTRGDISNLAELFVDPSAQSRGVGRSILEALLRHAAPTLFTDASSDPRAVALYARHGMTPRWPFYYLVGSSDRLTLPRSTITVADADWNDPAFLTSDLKCCGRPRLVDIPYLRDVRGSSPLWFRQGATTVGYGCIQARVGEFPGGTTMIGPLGARNPRDAVACLLAAVAVARRRSPVIRLCLPGPHPALVPLFDAGFTIADSDTFMVRGRARFCDPRIYVPSGPEFF